jgi:hypothetical protein
MSAAGASRPTSSGTPDRSRAVPAAAPRRSLLAGVGIQAIPPGHRYPACFWFSTYRRTTCSGAPPTVDTNHDELHKHGNRRSTGKQVHVIGHHLDLQHLHPAFCADLPNELLQSMIDPPDQYSAAVLRAEHKLVLHREHRPVRRPIPHDLRMPPSPDAQRPRLRRGVALTQDRSRGLAAPIRSVAAALPTRRDARIGATGSRQTTPGVGSRRRRHEIGISTSSQAASRRSVRLRLSLGT